MKILKIVLTCLSALCVAAVFPVAFFSAVGAACCFVGALAFAGGMFFVKRLEEKKEAKTAPKEADFFTPTDKD
ncbi:MAG: hypothetical protein IJV80_02340 [Clostridia bacterium]|nr:hypothetical protein [Clostridia bacterium]